MASKEQLLRDIDSDGLTFPGQSIDSTQLASETGYAAIPVGGSRNYQAYSSDEDEMMEDDLPNSLDSTLIDQYPISDKGSSKSVLRNFVLGLCLISLLGVGIILAVGGYTNSSYVPLQPAQQNLKAKNGTLDEQSQNTLLVNQSLLGTEESEILNIDSSESDINKKKSKKVQLRLDDINSGIFYPRTPSWDWVTRDIKEDGYYTQEDDQGNIWLRHAEEYWAGSSFRRDRILFNRLDIDRAEPTEPGSFSDYHISPDLKYVAVVTYYDKVWRHSFTAKYRIFNMEAIHYPPVVVAPNPRKDGPNITHYISLFKWSPQGHDAVFVLHNDVYVMTDHLRQVSRVSLNGDANHINGIPDWVYEEEVYAGNSCVWWSPNAQHIAYLGFDDTPVPQVQVPLYSNGAILTHANLIDRQPNLPLTRPPPRDPKQLAKFMQEYADYPQYIALKYPKSGYPNPRVAVYVYSIHRTDSSPRKVELVYNHDPQLELLVSMMQQDQSDQIICDVIWLDNVLLLRITNRAQDIVATAVVEDVNLQNDKLLARVVRLEPGGIDFGSSSSKKGDGGWYQTDSHPILPIPNSVLPDPSYVDRVVVDDYYHLALFQINGTAPYKILTKGQFDVDKWLGLDEAKGVLYYSSRELDSTASHIYSLDLATDKVKHVSDEGAGTLASLSVVADTDNKLDGLGHFSGSLSPLGGYMVLSYLGPHVPYHTLVRQGQADQSVILEKNKELRDIVRQYNLPKRHYTKIKVNGNMLNSVELHPATTKKSKKKMRVLFRCYGGPESQLVVRNFRIDFHYWLVSQLDDVAVVIVDGKGTAYQGRKFATVITGNLGYHEAADQLGAISHYSKLPWVDSKHLGLWGWSYGGYLTAKTVEADSQHLLSAAISVAPVTDWRYYDSIYTERYMKTPQLNPTGYSRSALTNVTNFNSTRYLLLHGLADDNVHPQNSLQLLDRFNLNKVYTTQFLTFPDNDHGIQSPASNRALYMKIFAHVRDQL